MQLQYALCGGNTGPIWPPLQNTFPDGTHRTAISWLCRPKVGFALAADGKARFKAETPEEENDLPPDKMNEKKIFVTKFKGRDIAYAFTGNIFTKQREFDLVRESRSAFDLIAKSNAQNIYEYIDRYARHIKTAVDNAKVDGRIKRYVQNPLCPVSEENVFARVFFAGYFRKHQPSFAVVTLRHEHQLLLDPEIRFETPPENDYFVGAGGGIAARIHGAEDHWVRAYAKPVSPNGSLDDLASLAEGFIRACSDPRAEEVDQSCKAIGGHVHVAELTPSGFKWRIAPIEEETCPVTAS